MYRLETKLNDLDISEPVFPSVPGSKKSEEDEGDRMVETPIQTLTPSHDITPSSDVSTPRNKHSWGDTKQFKANINWFDDDDDEENCDGFLGDCSSAVKENDFDHHASNDDCTSEVLSNNIIHSQGSGKDYTQRASCTDLQKPGKEDSRRASCTDITDIVGSAESVGFDAESGESVGFSAVSGETVDFVDESGDTVGEDYIVSDACIDENDLSDATSSLDSSSTEFQYPSLESRHKIFTLEQSSESLNSIKCLTEKVKEEGAELTAPQDVFHDSENVEEVHLTTPPEVFHDSEYDSDRDEFYSSYCESPGWE